MQKGRKYKRRYVKKDAKRLASAALRLARSNRRSIEVKEITNQSTGTVSSTGSVTSMTSIAEGDDLSQRNGRKVSLKSIQIRGFLLNNDLTTSDGTFVRMMIVRDNTFKSTAPLIADILQNSAVYGLRAQEPEKKKAYTVLYDKFMGVDVNSRNQITFEKFKKVSGEVIFDGTGSTTGNKGGLYLLLLSNRSSDLPTVNLQVRVRYTDA
tara:strand:+ start:772 stop:1398 length:627 start_codon:yes stop_codon:yes gene_type:complete